jgi:hypothetical protein
MAVRTTTSTSTADQPAQSRTSRRRLLRQTKAVHATEAALPLLQAAVVTTIFWTKPTTGTPKAAREQEDNAEDNAEDCAEDVRTQFCGRTLEGLEEDIAYCETEGLTQDVPLAVWWVRQWMIATPSAMNSTLEEWSEFLWNVCGFELDLPTAASALSPAFVAALAEDGVPFAIARLELNTEEALRDIEEALARTSL